MKTNKLYFKTIHVIESLHSGDLHTGRRLYDDLVPMTIVSNPSLTAYYWKVQTRVEFLDKLRWIAEESASKGESPILHIETHGDHDGIQVGSDELLSWAVLKPALTKINEISGVNLLVVLAACDGKSLVRVVDPTDRAPLFAMIGPKQILSAGEIECACLAFYRTLFDKRDGVIAWQAMNLALAPKTGGFSLFTAEWLFCEAFRAYLNTHCSEEELQQREDKIVADAQAKEPPVVDPALFRESTKAYLRDHRGNFERFRKEFFFCDLYPENSSRFALSFEDCTK